MSSIAAQPFHGSIVRGLDATDPTNIKVLGEAKLGGWIQDTRIVGNVLYAVSEDYGWSYGWIGGGGVIGGAPGVAIGVSNSTYNPDVIVSSVSFAGGLIQPIASKTYAGYGGVFNVTPNAIMLAHPVAQTNPNLPPPAQTTLQYLDITDPAGNIVERGSLTVDGSIQGWGADNGRWNLDFADGITAHVLGCAGIGMRCGLRARHRRLLESRPAEGRLAARHPFHRMVCYGPLRHRPNVSVAGRLLLVEQRDDAPSNLRPVEPRGAQTRRPDVRSPAACR